MLKTAPDTLRAVPTRDGSILKVDMRDRTWRAGEACGNYRDALLARRYDADDPYENEIGGEA